MKRNEILLLHGSDYLTMARRICEAAELAEMIGARDKKVALKPNMVEPTKPDHGATTHPELVCGVIEYLQAEGFSDIAIMESSWAGEKTIHAIKALGYDKISRRYGVPFVDLDKEHASTVDAAGMKLTVFDAPRKVDFMINMPVFKGHCQTNITCALKNNKGLLPANEKRRFHTLGLHKPIAHLNTVVRNDFILVDNICGDLDFESGGNPVAMDRLIAAADPVLCDAFVCRSMGYEIEDVPYIRLAEQLGVGSADVDAAVIRKLNEPQAGEGSIPMTRRVAALAEKIAAEDACSVCYGTLIYALHRMREEGRLKKIPPLAIGQGYRGKSCQSDAGELLDEMVGIGRCAAGCRRAVQWCPPKAREIVEFLSGL